MELDAIIISDAGIATYSQTSPLRLKIHDQLAVIQNLKAGALHSNIWQKPISWQNATFLNGVVLVDHLQKSGFNVALINNLNKDIDVFKELLKKKPRYIILSTTYVLCKKILRNTAADIKNLCSDVTIIAGGPFVYTSFLLMQKKTDPNYDTQSPAKDYLFLEFDPEGEPSIDYYIISQSGLGILTRLMAALDQNKEVSNIPNIASNDGQSYRYSAISSEAAYEDIKIDWANLPDDIFKSEVASAQASNGCPYNCAYCNFVKDPKSTHIKPIDDLIAELKAIQARGIRYVRFVDDNFRLGVPDLQAVCERILSESIELKWLSFLRLNSLKDVDPQLLKKAGCVEVQMGLESANEQILNNMNKRIDPHTYRPVIKALLSAGINVSACFIIGFPGETSETVNETIAFINSLNEPEFPGIFTWNIFEFNVVPLSPIYEPDNRKVYDLSGYMSNWKHCTLDSRTAKDLIRHAYLSIDTASPTFSGDDISLLESLTPQNRKEFFLKRHELAKQITAGAGIDDQDIAASFQQLFKKR